MKAKKVALWGILGALAIASSYLETLISPLISFPGARVGFSNVLTMASCLSFGLPGALYITAIKVLFALITRGGIAALLSLCGGVLSSLVMCFLFKTKNSLLSTSIISACTHSLAQLLISALLLGNAIFYYSPILLIISVLSGITTGIILKLLLPHFLKKEKSE